MAFAGFLLAHCLLLVSAVEIEPRGESDATSAPATGSFALNGELNDNFTCVPGCGCHLTDVSRSRYAVLCSGSAIRGFPAFLTEDLHQIESMTLTRTSIAQIDALRMFSSVAYLNINHSLVQAVDSHMASTFPVLETLLLAGNRLRQLNDFMMPYMTLREVDLSVNQLVGVDPSGSMSLRVLNLRQNLLANLDELGPSYQSLRRLDVSQNRLTLDSLSRWKPPPELEVLDLSGNQLQGSSNASFLQRLPQLQQLVLSGNQLESLAPVVNCLAPGSKLWKLSLAGNPFACSCVLYRDKERLAMQGVIIADSPACRMANGTEHLLMRLGSWICVDTDGGGGGGDGGLSAAGGLTVQSPMVIAIAIVAATGLACLLIGVGVCVCRRRQEAWRRYLQEQQQPEPEYPYNNPSVKSTNMTSSQASLATSCRSAALPYTLDPLRSRVFSKKLIPGGGTPQAMGLRSQSEQVLQGCRGSAPLPPIPDGTASLRFRQLPPQPRPEDYVDMLSGGCAYQQIPAPDAPEPESYDEVQLPQYQNVQLHDQARVPEPEGYVDMQ